MKIEIFPAAELRIKEIWRYTKDSWGTEQAETYTRGLGQTINRLPNQRHLWRPIDDEVLKGAFYK